MKTASSAWRLPPIFFGTLTLSYALTNETGFEVPTSVTIEVIGTPDAPTAVYDTLSLREDEETLIFTTALTDNGFDVDRDGIELTRILEMSGVTVENLGNGELRVAPLNNVAGDAYFIYELRDSTGLTDTARVDIAIVSVNDAPVISDIPVLEALEDTSFSIALPAGAITDPDGDAIAVSLRAPGGMALPEWLSFDVETRTLSCTPPQDFNGDVTLELCASDGFSQTLREITLSVAPVGDAPVASAPDQTKMALEWTQLSSVLSVTDAEGDAATGYTLWDDEGGNNWWVAGLGFVDATGGRSVAASAYILFQADATDSVQDLWIRAIDGTEFGVWDTFTLTTRTENAAPVVEIANQTVTPSLWTRLIDVITVSDAEGDTITKYALWDDTRSNSWWVDGLGFVDAASGHETASLADIWFQGDATDGGQTLFVRAYDGFEWGAWDDFTLATRNFNTPPEVPLKSISRIRRWKVARLCSLAMC